MSVFRHSLWASAAAVIFVGSRFAFTAIIARRMAVAEFGQYAYGQWLADFAFLLCSLGITGVIGRYVAQFRHDPAMTAAFVRRSRLLGIGLPGLAAALVPFGAVLSGLDLDPVALAWLSLWTLASGLWAVQTAMLSGLQRFDLVFLANGVAAVILLAGAMLLPMRVESAALTFGLMALASASAALVGYPVTRRLADGPRATIHRDQWRGMKIYAVNIWVTSLLWSLVWSRGEIPVVRAFLGDVGVAHYAAALTLFGGGMQGVMLAASGVAPQLTRLWGEGSHLQAIALARKVMDMQLLLSGVAALVLVCFSPELMRLAFGEAYGRESSDLAILGPGLIALALACHNHLLQIATDGRFSRNSTMLGLVVLIGSATFLVSVNGSAGGAMARSGTMLFMGAVSLLAVNRHWGEGSYSRGNIARVIVLVVASVAVQLQIAELGWPPRALLCAIAGTLLVVSVRDGHGRTMARVLLERLTVAFRPAPIVPTRPDKP